VLTFAVPHAPGVRVDAGIASGDEVSVYYDPMLAKLVAYAEDRPAAVRRLAWLLKHTAVLGIATNTPLLRAIAAESDFQAGATTTAYLDTHDLTHDTASCPVPAVTLAAAALWESLTAEPAKATPGSYNPWRQTLPTTASAERRQRYRARDEEHVVTLTPVAPTESGSYGQLSAAFAVAVDGQPLGDAPGACVTATIRPDGSVILCPGQRRERCYVARRGDDVLVNWRGESYTLHKPRPPDVDTTAHTGGAASGRQSLVAPMAGTIIKVAVAEGDEVDAHQTLVVLGAMKMEHAISAPHPGRVIRLPHGAGDVVPGGELLVELDAGGQ
jgi:3-methylcrotonyl-CoA carboxylase alpha subunit